MPNQPVSSRGVVVALLLLIIVVLIATIYGAWQFLPSLQQEPVPQANEEKPKLENIGLNDTSVTAADVGGILIISGVDTTRPTSSVMSYTLAQGAFANVSEQYNLPSTSFVEFADVAEPNKLFFKVFSAKNEADTPINTLFSADGTGAVTTVTQKYEQQFGTVAFSKASNKLAVMGLDEGTKTDSGALMTLADWQIEITDATGAGAPLIIEDAAHPTWQPTGERLLYVKPDGVYSFNFATNVESRLLAINLEDGGEPKSVTPATMVELSPDGKYLAITFESTGIIEMYSVDWNKVALTLIGRIVSEGMGYSWPVFAPDGLTYAVLARDIVDGEFANPHIEIRATLGRQVLSSYPLNNFDPEETFLDEWIARAPQL